MGVQALMAEMPAKHRGPRGAIGALEDRRGQGRAAGGEISLMASKLSKVQEVPLISDSNTARWKRETLSIQI